MLYRNLGKTGLKVSLAGIETHQWSGMGGRFFSVSDIRAILRRAEKLGINFIDTGECYFFHAAERLIGEALGARRKNFVIATKFGHKSEPTQIAPAWSGDEIKKQLADSLRALKSDYIDIYQAHINSKEDLRHFRANLLEIKLALEEAEKSGQIRSVGICLGDDVIFDENGKMLTIAVKALGISMVQVLYNRLERSAEKNVFPIAKKFNLGIVARVPLAKGYLSSRFKPTNKNYDAARLKMVEKIKTSELLKGQDLAEWAIGWCVQNALVSSVVPGCTALEQLDSTVRAVSLTPASKK